MWCISSYNIKTPNFRSACALSFHCILLTCRNICHGAGTWRSGPSFLLGPLPSCLALHHPALQRTLPSQWHPVIACWRRCWSTAFLSETKESWEGISHINSEMLQTLDEYCYDHWIIKMCDSTKCSYKKNTFLSCPKQHRWQNTSPEDTQFMKKETADILLWLTWCIWLWENTTSSKFLDGNPAMDVY